jgi:hypothetical protein
MGRMTFHEARNELTKALEKDIEKVVEKRQFEPNYYILVVSQVSNIDRDRIENKLILLSVRPEVPFIGTILYYVDNKKGELIREWVLPRDVIQPEETINKAGDFSDEIASCGKAANN